MNAYKNHIEDFTKLYISLIVKATELLYESVRDFGAYLLDKLNKSNIIRAPLVLGFIWNLTSDQEKILSTQLKRETITFRGRGYRRGRGNFQSLRRPRKAAKPITKKTSKFIE